MAKKEFWKLVVMGASAFLIMFILILTQSPDFGFSGALVMGIVFAGVPYGWILSGRLLHNLIVIGSAPIMIIAFFLRVILALLVGWIAYPIQLIRVFLRMRRGE